MTRTELTHRLSRDSRDSRDSESLHGKMFSAPCKAGVWRVTVFIRRLASVKFDGSIVPRYFMDTDTTQFIGADPDRVVPAYAVEQFRPYTLEGDGWFFLQGRDSGGGTRPR